MTDLCWTECIHNVNKGGTCWQEIPQKDHCMLSYILSTINLYSWLYELLSKYCLYLYYNCSVDKIWLYGNSVGNIWSRAGNVESLATDNVILLRIMNCLSSSQQNTFLKNASIAAPFQNPVKANVDKIKSDYDTRVWDMRAWKTDKDDCFLLYQSSCFI